MYKVDLHTHSIISPDGGISSTEYERLLGGKRLDCIAITDHNEIRFAKELHQKLGDKIIVGEEITTSEGEMIGLFLKEKVQAGMSALETAKEIQRQGGLVYIPHPFEIFRKGIHLQVLEKIVSEIAIIEVFNGRGRWRGKAKQAEAFAKKYHLAKAASSDAHGRFGIGQTFSTIAELPTKQTLPKLLDEGKREKVYAPLFAFLYPIINRVKHLFS